VNLHFVQRPFVCFVSSSQQTTTTSSKTSNQLLFTRYVQCEESFSRDTLLPMRHIPAPPLWEAQSSHAVCCVTVAGLDYWTPSKNVRLHQLTSTCYVAVAIATNK
jgi:hypothetical protein